MPRHYRKIISLIIALAVTPVLYAGAERAALAQIIHEPQTVASLMTEEA